MNPSGGRWILLAASLSLALFFGLTPRHARAAATLIDSFVGHQTWQSAAVVPSLRRGMVAFGQLRGSRDSRFYRVAVATATTVEVELNDSLRSQARFHPQLVVFQPEVFTFGPALPMEQPPNTLGLVYGADENDVLYDASTQTRYRRRLLEDITLPVAGTYYLAVYNAGGQEGQFRLALRSGQSRGPAMATYPAYWWRAQTWAGLSLNTFFLPLITLLIVSLGVWLGLQLLPAPQKKSRRRSRK